MVLCCRRGATAQQNINKIVGGPTPQAGFEPATSALGKPRSIQLSYWGSGVFVVKTHSQFTSCTRFVHVPNSSGGLPGLAPSGGAPSLSQSVAQVWNHGIEGTPSAGARRHGTWIESGRGASWFFRSASKCWFIGFSRWRIGGINVSMNSCFRKGIPKCMSSSCLNSSWSVC